LPAEIGAGRGQRDATSPKGFLDALLPAGTCEERLEQGGVRGDVEFELKHGPGMLPEAGQAGQADSRAGAYAKPIPFLVPKVRYAIWRTAR